MKSFFALIFLTFLIACSGGGGTANNSYSHVKRYKTNEQFRGKFSYTKKLVRDKSTITNLNNTSTQTFMVNSRYAHNAVLMHDGKVLITGGIRSSNSPSMWLTSAEVYDPLTGIFTATANDMSVGRVCHSSCVLPDGRVILVGGADTTTEQASDYVEAYDPITNSFSVIGHLQIPVYVYSGIYYIGNDQILAIGGPDNGVLLKSWQYKDGTPINSSQVPSQIINISTGESFVVSQDPTYWWDAAGSVQFPDGKIAIIGGWNGNQIDGSSSAQTNVYLFDPITEQFTVLATNVPFATSSEYNETNDIYPMVFISNGKVLIETWVDVWSMDEQGNYQKTNNQPSLFASGQSSTLLDNGNILTTGGYYFAGGMYQNEQIICDPTSQTSGFTGNMLEIRGMGQTTTLLDGTVLISGGSPYPTAEIFDPQNAIAISYSTTTVISGSISIPQIINPQNLQITWTASMGTIDQNGVFTAPILQPSDLPLEVTIVAANNDSNIQITLTVLPQ